jgi:hypothetical protein
MNEDFWETKVLPVDSYYKKVLIDGCVIKKGDTELCDLRHFVRRYSQEERPRLQIYKENRGGTEYTKLFYNYEEAITEFIKLGK